MLPLHSAFNSMIDEFNMISMVLLCTVLWPLVHLTHSHAYAHTHIREEEKNGRITKYVLFEKFIIKT